jgi:hypothetical protein
MTRPVLVVVWLAVAVSQAGAQAPVPSPSLDDVVARASIYVRDYVARSSLLVAEERYVQEIRRPDNNPVAGNLSRANPGGGFASGGGVRKRQVLRSDYLLVRLGGGGGWMPFRDVFEVNGSTVTDRNDRLTKLFLEPSATSLDQATRIMADSTRYNVGTLTRTVNIPTLALMFMHPDIRPRFTFSHEGDDTVAGRAVWVLEYHERERPTLIKTTRGRDLAVTGKVWVEPASGAVLKTAMTAADPLVRAVVTTTYRDDAALQFWVPGQMDEHYVTGNDVDELLGYATYTNFRRFTVNTDDALRKPPPEHAARQ